MSGVHGVCVRGVVNLLSMHSLSQLSSSEGSGQGLVPEFQLIPASQEPPRPERQTHQTVLR